MTEQISAAARADLRALVAQWWSRHAPPLSLEEAEQLALTLSRELAQEMTQVAMAPISGPRSYEGSSRPCGCGQEARFVGYRVRSLRTLCGEVRVQRAYYHCRTCHRGECPWDRRQGLNDGFSPGVKALVVEACGRLPYREAAHLLERAAGLKVEESSQQQIVGTVGERLRAEEAAAIEAYFERYEPLETPARPRRLYVSMDAVKAHTGGEWHDIKAAVIYTATGGEDGIDQAGEQQYVAAQEPASAFGRRLYLTAARQGVEHAGEVVTLGDGAEWVWNLAQEHYPGSQEILDYWHAAEHVWEVARALYGRESREGARWARKQCRLLKEEGPRKLLASLARRRPKEPAVQEVVRRELAYFRSHKHRMQYPQYVTRGLMIGSGVVEATCKVIVTQRLKHAGMRWSEPGADAVLAVRTTLLNGAFHRIARHCRAT